MPIKSAIRVAAVSAAPSVKRPTGSIALSDVAFCLGSVAWFIPIPTCASGTLPPRPIYSRKTGSLYSELPAWSLSFSRAAVYDTGEKMCDHPCQA